MLSFLTTRLLQIIPTLILVSMLIFGLQQLLPGDPALIMAGEERDPKVLAERLPGGLTDGNVEQVLDMRQEQGMGWGQIAKSQGTTLGAAKQGRPYTPPDDGSAVQPRSVSRSGKPANGTKVASSSPR